MRVVGGTSKRSTETQDRTVSMNGFGGVHVYPERQFEVLFADLERWRVVYVNRPTSTKASLSSSSLAAHTTSSQPTPLNPAQQTSPLPHTSSPGFSSFAARAGVGLQVPVRTVMGLSEIWNVRMSEYPSVRFVRMSTPAAVLTPSHRLFLTTTTCATTPPESASLIYQLTQLMGCNCHVTQVSEPRTANAVKGMDAMPNAISLHHLSLSHVDRPADMNTNPN